MKRLFVLRHAKSSWDDPNLSDFERPLNKRGNNTAPFMGRLMAEKGLIPEYILSSPAQRAKSTAELVKKSAEIDAEIGFERNIYEAGLDSLLKTVSNLSDEFQSVMIVGHNWGFEELVQALTGKHERMPTAALAVIDFPVVSWKQTETEAGELIEILRPREQE